MTLSTREWAVALVSGVVEDHVSLSTLWPQLQGSGLNGRDQAFVKLLVFQSLRHYGGLMAWCCPHWTRSPPLRIQHFILVGLAQIAILKTPAYAAVCATVEATPKKYKNLVNAVLRQCLRQPVPLDASLPNTPLKNLVQHTASAHWSQIQEAWMSIPKTTVRCQSDRLSYQKVLADAGISTVFTRYAADGLRCDRWVGPDEFPGFTQGTVYLQDEGAQLAVDLLKPQPGQRILDACSGVGGKASHLFLREPLAELVCCEPAPKAAQQWYDNQQRLGFRAQLCEVDVRHTQDWWDGQSFDAILIDAPCSGSGVVRRHPDILFLRQQSDWKKYAALQKDLLEKLWPLLKVGGHLLYSTCSLLTAENDDVVGGSNLQNAQFLPIQAQWGEATRYGRQVWCDVEMDGFYYSLIKKY